MSVYLPFSIFVDYEIFMNNRDKELSRYAHSITDRNDFEITSANERLPKYRFCISFCSRFV